MLAESALARYEQNPDHLRSISAPLMELIPKLNATPPMELGFGINSIRGAELIYTQKHFLKINSIGVMESIP